MAGQSCRVEPERSVDYSVEWKYCDSHFVVIIFFKNVYGRNDYLFKNKTKAGTTLAKISANNNRLLITVGRYRNTPGEESIYAKCDAVMTGGEYHVVFACNDQLQRNYIQECFWITPDRHRYWILMLSGNVRILNNFFFIKYLRYLGKSVML